MSVSFLLQQYSSVCHAKHVRSHQILPFLSVPFTAYVKKSVHCAANYTAFTCLSFSEITQHYVFIKSAN